jgi:hypothetical protein
VRPSKSVAALAAEAAVGCCKEFFSTLLKQRFARRLLAGKKRSTAQSDRWPNSEQHVWQRRFYDFNVWSARKRIEKLRCMHRNPVKRGLVLEPDQWEWSSFRSYAHQWISADPPFNPCMRPGLN